MTNLHCNGSRKFPRIIISVFALSVLGAFLLSTISLVMLSQMQIRMVKEQDDIREQIIVLEIYTNKIKLEKSKLVTVSTNLKGKLDLQRDSLNRIYGRVNALLMRLEEDNIARTAELRSTIHETKVTVLALLSTFQSLNNSKERHLSEMADTKDALSNIQFNDTVFNKKRFKMKLDIADTQQLILQSSRSLEDLRDLMPSLKNSKMEVFEKFQTHMSMTSQLMHSVMENKILEFCKLPTSFELSDMLLKKYGSHIRELCPGFRVRLVNGGPKDGRVEILHQGEWGTICDAGWDIRDAAVVCRTLGYEKATSALCCSTYGNGTGRIWMNYVNCEGTEKTIFECEKQAWGIEDCDHMYDASVVCS